LALATDDIADIDVGKELERGFAQRVDVCIDLQIVPAVAKGDEDRLTVLAPGHDPAGHTVLAGLVLLPLRQFGVLLSDLAEAGAGFETASVRLYVGVAQPLHFRQAVALPVRHV
jgi:hypothetical protein